MSKYTSESVSFRAKDGEIVTLDRSELPALRDSARARRQGLRTDHESVLARLTDFDLGVVINWPHSAAALAISEARAADARSA